RGAAGSAGPSEGLPADDTLTVADQRPGLADRMLQPGLLLRQDEHDALQLPANIADEGVGVVRRRRPDAGGRVDLEPVLELRRDVAEAAESVRELGRRRQHRRDVRGLAADG